MSNNNYNTNKKSYKVDKNDILKDINKKGKDNNWKERKKDNLNLADSYKRLKDKKYYRVIDCSTFLEFGVTKTTNLKLLNANFCKVRLCPMCAWRRSLKIFGQVSKVMDYVEENYDYRYIFLTLTVQNCYGEDLKNTLDLMTNAFNKMNQRKAFKQSIKGYFRSLEITYNKKDDTYHPHFHLILAVNKSYFTDKDYYLSQENWTKLWKESLKIDYTPIVDVRRIISNSKDKSFSKVIAETAKYTVKSDDFLIKDENEKIDEERTDKVVAILDKALHRKRLVSFGFLFKEIHKQLKLDDAEDGDLNKTDNDNDLRDDLTNIILRYQWNIGIKNYKLVEVLEDDTVENGGS